MTMLPTILVSLLATVVSVCTLSAAGHRQQKPAIAPVVRPGQPGVFITDSTGRNVPMRIRNLQVDVQIVGTIARTTFDMTVVNPHNRVLEGSFSFPVADGQQVARFALDLNGTMRDGVVVDKTKGRATFESIVRQKVDPALLEWTRDNAFRTRIYPIPARGTRRVAITFEQTLSADADGVRHVIPFGFAERVDTFHFTATVAGFGLRPSLAGDNVDTVLFAPRGRTYQSSFTATNIVLDKPYTLSVPILPNLRYAAVSTVGGVRCMGAMVSLPALRQPRPVPRRLALVVDASLSAGRRDRSAEADVLQALFARLRTADVVVIPFSDTAGAATTFQVRNGDWKSLADYLAAVVYDGGTQLANAPLTPNDADMVLLLSDGISTFGDHTPRTGTVPVMCLSSGTQADHATLRAIATATNGSYVDLTTTTADDAVAAILDERLVISAIRVVDGQVDSILPRPMIPVSGLTAITGLLRTDEATLVIESSIGGAVHRYDTITVSAFTDADTTPVMGRLWAQQELARLSADRDRQTEAITALGRRFSIVTPGTSLLVLEQLDDFLRYDVEPPANEPALLAAWQQRIEAARTMAAARRQTHAADVARMANDLRQPIRYQASSKQAPDRAVLALEDLPDIPIADKGVTIRASRITETAVLVDGLTVSDQFTGGLGNSTLTTQDIAVSEDLPGTDAAPSVSQPAPADAELARRRNETMRTLDQTPGMSVQGTGVSVRGSRSMETQVLVDGLAVADQFTGGIAHVTPDSTMTITPNAPNPFVAAKRAPGTLTTIPAYRTELLALPAADVYAAYLRLRPTYGHTTAFFLDVADVLRERGRLAEARRVLSNLAERDAEDHRSLRILAHRLMQVGDITTAIRIYRDVVRMRSEEPQSWRDLALALAEAGQYDEAAAAYRHIITTMWDTRFPEIERTAMIELSHLVSRAGARLDRSTIDTTWLVPFEADIRVVVTWDADNYDLDLHISDPTGAHCFYRAPRTPSGGVLSRDLTGGYGPEVFTQTKTTPGTYVFTVHPYQDRQQTAQTMPTTAMVTIYRNYGRANERVETRQVRIEDQPGMIAVGTITMP